MKLKLSLTLYTKISSKWTTNENIKHKIMKLLEGKKKHPSKSGGGGKAGQEHDPSLLCLGIKSLLGNTSDGFKFYK